MAITYNLELATPTPAEQVAADVVGFARAGGLLDGSVPADAALGSGTRTLPGMWVQVVAATPPPWDAVVHDLGFTPTVSVGFRLDKDGDIEAQQDDMVRLTVGLLSRVPGDAVLHSAYEDIWLLRRDGTLTVNERDDIWPAQRLASVSLPYQRITHTFADD